MFHFVLLSVCKAVWKLLEPKQTKSTDVGFELLNVRAEVSLSVI
jgi:hypothetical protein